MADSLLVLTNVPDQESAYALAEKLVAQEVAACVNCLSGVQSFYRWQGKIEQAAEITLLIKTARHRYADLESAILKAHPYEVPEIIALPIERGLPAYLAWVAEETQGRA